jgi:hypothetical protein
MTNRDDESEDVYQDLSAELIALLRDPRVLLPGELDAFDSAAHWSPVFDGDAMPANAAATRTYISAQQPLPRLTSATSSTTASA